MKTQTVADIAALTLNLPNIHHLSPPPLTSHRVFVSPFISAEQRQELEAVTTWLEDLGLGRHAPTFFQERVRVVDAVSLSSQHGRSP
mmetsp:Transcript_55938/g.121696  ORF Transcript_55938/g.121696 Transcript_55938/m.121696 type:complete len:87 (-) Transcript_55938:60-320(-)